ncbi:MAG: hypothetical protein IJQ99_10365 [Synergistaceae bacterium]|nr:hypothetical protein [Synergistaceae bacterium]MBR0253450.1 hypothetical protein [Synergistaceae bacterium]MBR0317259.1 hypothetical protein [Synergistaceae bacterium]
MSTKKTLPVFIGRNFIHRRNIFVSNSVCKHEYFIRNSGKGAMFFSAKNFSEVLA